MRKHDDWFDDFMIMQMMGEDEESNSGSGGSSANSGCLPGIIVVLSILLILSLFK